MSRRRSSSLIAGVVVAVALAVSVGGCGDPAAPATPVTKPDSVAPPSTAALDSAERAPYAPDDTLFASVVVSGTTSCALTRGGRAFCWGDDGEGQLGVARAVGYCPLSALVQTCVTTPVPVDSGRRFVALTMASTLRASVCGLTVIGRVWCWGGVTVPHGPWLAPSGATRYARLADSAPCAIRTTGAIDCFAFTLPDATYHPWVGAPSVAPLAGTEGHTFTSAGPSCGTTSDGAMYCWDVVDATLFAVAGVPHDVCQGGGSPGMPTYYYACHYPAVRLTLPVSWEHAASPGPSSLPPCCGVTRDGQLAVWAEWHYLSIDEWSTSLFVDGRRPGVGGAPAFVAVPE